MTTNEILARIMADVEMNRGHGVREKDITIILSPELYDRMCADIYGFYLSPDGVTLFGSPVRVLVDTRNGEEWFVSVTHGVVPPKEDAK